MKRFVVFPLFVAVLACPGEKKVSADTIPLDTMPADLSGVQPDIPAAAPDTFTPRQIPRATQGSGPSVPAAPPALQAAVEREQAFSRFCYQEFGQKADPTLRGGVAMVVTVSGSGIADARVANDNWSSRAAGTAVNRCLNEKAKLAWKLSPGEVKAGKYVVQLRFTSSG